MKIYHFRTSPEANFVVNISALGKYKNITQILTKKSSKWPSKKLLYRIGSF